MWIGIAKAAIRFGVNEKSLEFLVGQHLHIPDPLGRQLTTHRRVSSDLVRLYCLIQCYPAFGDISNQIDCLGAYPAHP